MHVVSSIIGKLGAISEKAVAPHSSALAWKIPWTEEPGRLWSMGLLRVGHDWPTSLLLFTFLHWRRKRQPTPVFLPGESQGRGAWWAAIYGVTQIRTWLKRLSSSSRGYMGKHGAIQKSNLRSHRLLDEDNKIKDEQKLMWKEWEIIFHPERRIYAFLGTFTNDNTYSNNFTIT